MEFTTHIISNIVEVYIFGRLEFSDHDKIHQIVKFLDVPNLECLSFELSNLEFIDSTGLGMFLYIQEVAQKMEIPIILRGARGEIRSLFELTKLDEIISIVY
jgi:HptB-dependent secretion and biofilm anti anti-sigma factor